MSNNKSLEMFGAWSGLIFLLVFGVGWLFLAWFFPPISPAAPAEDVAALFRDRHLPLMLASVIMMMSVVFLMPGTALMLLVLQKIEQRAGMLTIMMGITAITGIVLTFYTALSWSAAAFRPDRSPELVLLMSDFGFLQFMGGIPMFFMMWLIMAYAILVISPRENPMLPRWFGYFNLWTAILYLPELLIYFFKTGPFAWDGIIGFWIPAILLIIYFAVTPLVFVPVVRKHF